jgi:hypothetical protein
VSEIGVTVAQEFMPGSVVKLHRAGGAVISPGMEGPVLAQQVADSEGSVTFTVTDAGHLLEAGTKVWVFGRGPDGLERHLAMQAKQVRSPSAIKAPQAKTRSEDSQASTAVKGVRTTANTRPKPASRRKASPRAAAAPKKAAKSHGSAKK